MQLHESRPDIVSEPAMSEPTGKAIVAEAHRGFVGMQMFCKLCKGVLDYRRAVDITASRVSDGSNQGTVICCTSCFDAGGKGINLPKLDGVVFHVIDGREL